MSPIEQVLAPGLRVLNPLVAALSLDQASVHGNARQLMAEVLGTFGSSSSVQGRPTSIGGRVDSWGRWALVWSMGSAWR